MRRKPEITEMPTRLLAVALGSERRWKRTIAFAVVGAVVVGGGVYAAIRAVDANASAEAQKAWSELGVCLVGEPLHDGEKASSRVHAIELAVVGMPADKRAKPNELPWPASCASYASALGEAEKGASASLSEAASALATALRQDTEATADLTAAVDKVWGEAAAQKLATKPVTGITAAPKPAAPVFTSEAFKALPRLLTGSFSLSSVHAQPFAGDRVRFVVDDKSTPEGPVVCAAEAKSPTIKCERMPEAAAKRSPGVMLWGTTDPDAKPYLFAGDRGELGIYALDGKDKVADGVALGASAHADGALWALLRKDDVRLLLKPATGPAFERPALAPTEVASNSAAGLFFNLLAYESAGHGAPPHLMVRTLDKLGTPGAPVDVGALGEGPVVEGSEKQPLLSACRSDEATVVRARGGKGDFIAFFVGDKWTAPIEMPTRGGALTCRGTAAVATQVAHASGDKDFATITQATCTPSGCSGAKVELRSLLAGLGTIAPADANGLAAADVGGKLAVAWNGGIAGGLRLRFGAADRLDHADDTVVVDGRGGDAGMKLSSVVEIRAVPANDFALLFVNTTSGVHVLRIEKSGSVTPMQVTL